MPKIKITPLSVILIAIEVLLIFTAFYYLAIENSNGMALAGIIALIATFINALLFAVQQIIANIKGLNKKVLWTIEILIIIAGILYIGIYGISIG